MAKKEWRMFEPVAPAKGAKCGICGKGFKPEQRKIRLNPVSAKAKLFYDYHVDCLRAHLRELATA